MISSPMLYGNPTKNQLLNYESLLQPQTSIAKPRALALKATSKFATSQQHGNCRTIKDAYYDQTWRRTKRQWRVVCLSEVPNNILMWSHFTESHKGVVFGLALCS